MAQENETGNGNPENAEIDVALEQFDAQTDKEVEEAGDDPVKLKEIIKIRTESRQKLYARAKDAETKLKDFKPADSKQDKKATSTTEKELSYDKKAYLVALGYKDSDEMSIIQEAMTATGKSLEEVLANKFVQAEISDLREKKSTEEALPKGGSTRGSNPSRNSVDYWLAKGELPPADQVDLRRKVVNERMKREANTSKFGGQ
jgi:hypothetical protein